MVQPSRIWCYRHWWFHTHKRVFDTIHVWIASLLAYFFLLLHSGFLPCYKDRVESWILKVEFKFYQSWLKKCIISVLFVVALAFIGVLARARRSTLPWSWNLAGMNRVSAFEYNPRDDGMLFTFFVRYRKQNGDFFAAMNIFLYLCPQI